MSNGFSIQRRIVIVGLLILSVAVLAMGVISYQYAQRASDRAFDRLLTASALTVANAIRNEDGALLVELPYSAMAMLPKNEKVFYVVRSAEQLIAGYPDLDADLPLANSEQPAYQNIHYKNLHLRISSIGRFSSGSSQGEPQWLTIRVAETRNTRETLAKELFTQSLLPMGVLIALAIVILALGIRIAFSPLRTLKSELQTRSPTNLNPITRPVPSEISGLVQTLNAFMLRLGNAMQTMQTLVADAAHQIRTPMSSLRLQSELALLETDKKRQHELLEAIHRNCAQTSKLINQMLMDATITHRRNTTVFSSLAPQTLIKDSVSRLSPEERSRISVNLTPPAQQAELAGDPIALREMLRNLLENALLYAPDSDVEIRTYLSLEKKLVFDVSDRGPGLSASEAESVMERFVRGSTAGKTLGSGLGLAIAQNVAKAHGGSLQLRQRYGPGLTVRIELPIKASNSSFRSASSVLLTVLAATLVVASVLPTRVFANTPYFYPAPIPSSVNPMLNIAGPTDHQVVGSLVAGFQEKHPDVNVHYEDIDTQDLYVQTVSGQLEHVDVLISSAVDLQLKLANDGYAQAHRSVHAAKIPEWAKWRNEVFGFTLEPIVLVYSKALLPAHRAPTRAGLLNELEKQRDGWFDRIGTYDIRRSGLGYLLAVHDERSSYDFWGMTNALGRAGVRLYDTTGEILEDLVSGKLSVGYNLLGSYAYAWQKEGAPIEIVIPNDYVLVFSRTALIRNSSPRPDLAKLFIDYLLSDNGQKIVAETAYLGSIIQPEGVTPTGLAPKLAKAGTIQSLELSPALLVALDPARKQRFIQNWERLITDTPAPLTGR